VWRIKYSSVTDKIFKCNVTVWNSSTTNFPLYTMYYVIEKENTSISYVYNENKHFFWNNSLRTFSITQEAHKFIYSFDQIGNVQFLFILRQQIPELIVADSHSIYYFAVKIWRLPFIPAWKIHTYYQYCTADLFATEVLTKQNSPCFFSNLPSSRFLLAVPALRPYSKPALRFILSVAFHYLGDSIT